LLAELPALNIERILLSRSNSSGKSSERRMLNSNGAGMPLGNGMTVLQQEPMNEKGVNGDGGGLCAAEEQLTGGRGAEDAEEGVARK
jgi:hypothetical protein